MEPEVIQTADTSYSDLNFTANQTNYYRISAVDHAGNISEYSAVVEAAVLSIVENMVPEIFALHQNFRTHLIQLHRFDMTFQRKIW